MITNYILIFCSGLTFAVGGINLAIGSIRLKDRSYLFFGLLSLFASIFLILQLSSFSTSNNVHIIDIASIFIAATFYTLFLWFIGEYTGFKKTKIQVSISLMVVLLILLFFMADLSIISWQVWEVMAHATILLISIYGIMAGIRGLKDIGPLWKAIYIFMMFALFFLTIVVGTSTVYNINLIYDPQGFISPLDFFPVFFSIIMGSKMSHDIIRSDFLDKELKSKEGKWSSLMESINLLVVELNPDGDIQYVNSYFSKLTGYSLQESVGENWFKLMLYGGGAKDLEKIFSEVIKGKEIPVYQNLIKLKDGLIKNIQWSNIHLGNSTGKISGILSIGADVTNREAELAEIKDLKNQLEKENLLLKEEIKWKEYSNEIIGESDAIKYVLKRATQVSDTNSTVLLEGETGVGKELFANLIHREGMRKNHPFIKVNCAALPKELIESELFGHEKGSFTGAIKARQGRFELADKGTIFLDEIGELPLDLQAKMLRVLQSGEFEPIGSERTKRVDVRIIAATNLELQEETNKGRFRQDLFYRLNVYPITIPPLRQRLEDIPILVRNIVDKIGRKIGRKIKHISKADMLKLQKYNWPGNVRELENVIERAIINSPDDTLVIDNNQLKNVYTKNLDDNSSTTEPTLSLNQKSHIITILEDCNWKINGEKGAAQKLGIPPSTLRSKMKKLNIERPQDHI